MDAIVPSGGPGVSPSEHNGYLVGDPNPTGVRLREHASEVGCGGARYQMGVAALRRTGRNITLTTRASKIFHIGNLRRERRFSQEWPERTL